MLTLRESVHMISGPIAVSSSAHEEKFCFISLASYIAIISKCVKAI